jgi:hypothetical protein
MNEFIASEAADSEIPGGAGEQALGSPAVQ